MKFQVNKSLLCLIKHKWEYKEKIVTIFGITYIPVNATRYCSRCHTKEIYKEYVSFEGNPGLRWVEIDLNIGEKRSILLDNILD